MFYYSHTRRPCWFLRKDPHPTERTRCQRRSQVWAAKERQAERARTIPVQLKPIQFVPVQLKPI